MLPFYNQILEESKQRIGSVSRVPSFASNLYTFYYRSKSGNDSAPFVMLMMSRRTGTSFYTAKNGHRYMLAINLNYVTSGETRAMLIRRFANKGPISWRHAMMIGKQFTHKSERAFGAANPGMMKTVIDPAKVGEENVFRLESSLASLFVRQYDVRKLRDLAVVDSTKYLDKAGFTES